MMIFGLIIFLLIIAILSRHDLGSFFIFCICPAIVITSLFNTFEDYDSSSETNMNNTMASSDANKDENAVVIIKKLSDGREVTCLKSDTNLSCDWGNVKQSKQ